MRKTLSVVLALCTLIEVAIHGAEIAQWEVFETSYETKKAYANPFTDIEVNVVFERAGKRWTMPAFWAGGGKWTIRFAPPAEGEYRYRVECSDQSNADLAGNERTFRAVQYEGVNPLLKHGFLRVSANKRFFEHADGTPFFWLGDTWWKGLAKRLTWDGFQELTADCKAKGFSVVQIVCGRYPDEGGFEAFLGNSGSAENNFRTPEGIDCGRFLAPDPAGTGRARRKIPMDLWHRTRRRQGRHRGSHHDSPIENHLRANNVNRQKVASQPGSQTQ